MDAGASDAIYTSAAGMPTYGIAGLAIDRDDERAHGRDERIGVAAFYEGERVLLPLPEGRLAVAP